MSCIVNIDLFPRLPDEQWDRFLRCLKATGIAVPITLMMIEVVKCLVNWSLFFVGNGRKWERLPDATKHINKWFYFSWNPVTSRTGNRTEYLNSSLTNVLIYFRTYKKKCFFCMKSKYLLRFLLFYTFIHYFDSKLLTAKIIVISIIGLYSWYCYFFWWVLIDWTSRCDNATKKKAPHTGDAFLSCECGYWFNHSVVPSFCKGRLLFYMPTTKKRWRIILTVRETLNSR